MDLILLDRKTMFMSAAESQFILSHLKDNYNVLEWGSGESTLEISKMVKSLLSIEHQKEWFNTISKSMPSNVTLVLKEPNLPYQEGVHCGTYEEFKDYVEYPLNYGPFDIIFIDGRSRTSCASICNKISHKDTLIFVHDFTDIRIEQDEYYKMYDCLEKIDSVESMCKFKIKN